MSDVFLSAGEEVTAVRASQDMCFTPHTRSVHGVGGGAAWAVSRVDDWRLWGPAFDDKTSVRVLIGGRIALEELDWARAERAPYAGGLAARHILERWLTRGSAGVEDYNGAASIIVIDETNRRAHLWTDRMGFYPMFAANVGAVIASHPDVLSRALAATGRRPLVDETTIGEFIRTGAATHPHTYWCGVRQLDGGHRFTIQFDAPGRELAGERYWRPAYADGAPALSRKDFVERLAEAFKASGRRRSWSRLGRVAVLLSSGVDSRGVLGALASVDQTDCYTYYDEPNEELAGAHAIASLAGVQHTPLRRAPDHYPAHAEATVALSGGMWSFDSGHHAGLVEQIRAQSSPGVLLTGCYCDYLFKGIALNRRNHELFGRSLPLYRIAPYNHEFYLPFSPIDPERGAAVNERLDARFDAGLRDARDPRLVELARLSPISREADASGRMTLWRTAPFDVFVADNDILDAYGMLSVEDKISGIAFGQAIARVTGRAIADVPNNNFGVGVGADEVGRVTAFLVSSARRKLRRALRGRAVERCSIATTGSWPNFYHVALASPAMREWFGEFKNSEAISSWLHPSRRSWTLEDFAARDVFQLYRLVTVHLWLKSQAAKSHAHAGALGFQLS